MSGLLVRLLISGLGLWLAPALIRKVEIHGDETLEVMIVRRDF